MKDITNNKRSIQLCIGNEIIMKGRMFYIIILLMCTLLSCKKKNLAIQRDIDLSNLKKDIFDSTRTYTSLEILKTYPIQKNCTFNKQYANLYICKERLTRHDTIYVFDECEAPPDYALDTSMNLEVGIVSRDTLKDTPKYITVFVPRDFRISKNTKYVFARLQGAML